jgi:hypothetical protein
MAKLAIIRDDRAEQALGDGAIECYFELDIDYIVWSAELDDAVRETFEAEGKPVPDWIVGDRQDDHGEQIASPA